MALATDLYPALQALSWLIASIGGVVVALIGVAEMHQTRVWRKTELAKKILDEIWADEKCAAAMMQVDWSNREFDIGSNELARISRDDLLVALRTDPVNSELSKKEVFVRDYFDNLLDALQRLEHFIDIELIDFDDVKDSLEYTVDELTGIRREIERYITAYNFHSAASFLDRYEQWRNHQNKGRPPCVQA